MTDSFVDLDFHHGLPSHSFVDKVAGVRVNIGRPSIIPPAYRNLQEKYGDVLLGLQESGIARDKMDRMCDLLALNCKSLGIDLLVTKSNRPFDSQWYYFGDIEALLKASKDELIRPPFTSAVHDQILRAIDIVLRS